MKKRATLKAGWYKALIKLLPIFFKASPVLFVSVCVIGILNSAFFVIETVAMRKLVDGATNLVEHKDIFMQVILYAVTFGIVKLFQQMINSCANYLAEYNDYFMTGKLQELINNKCCRIEAIYYEKVDFLDDLEKSSQGMCNCVSLISVSLMIFTNSIPYIIFVSVFLYGVHPSLAVSVFIIFVPILFNHLFTSKMYSKLEEDAAPLRRELNNYEKCICDKKYIKDTRMLGVHSHFFELYRSVLRKLSGKELANQKKVCLRNGISKVVTLTGYFGVLGLLIHNIIQGEISVGSFSAIFYSLSTMLGLMSELVDRHIGELSKNIGTINNFLKLIEYPEKSKIDYVKEVNGDIVFENVSFKYPNSEQYALKDVSFRIHLNETIAIVGVNGSGKTTLVKLLLGIYKPTSGVIRYEETNIRNGQSGGSKLSAVFQDYGKYPFTLQENIQISDFYSEVDSKSILNAIKKVDIDCESSTFPKGMETILSKEFGGIDLSIGQWQRIAIARGYYRQHGLIILDEPTAAIDPLEEGKVYNAFKELSKDKTAIVVTHRLGVTRIADRIIVLDNGILDSEGTHDELMNLDGRYKTIFLSQAKWYY